MIQFIAGLFIGGFIVFMATRYIGSLVIKHIDEGLNLREVDEHGRMIYRAEEQK